MPDVAELSTAELKAICDRLAEDGLRIVDEDRIARRSAYLQRRYREGSKPIVARVDAERQGGSA